MTRLQGGATNPPDVGYSSNKDRHSFHFSKLPHGSPDVISRNTVVVTDPTRVSTLAKEERQRNFNLLVKRYKSQLIYGCQEPNCTTPTCLSYRRRATEAPLRKFTDLSARTVACFLASQDNPERGLCNNKPVTNPDSLAQDGGRRSSKRFRPSPPPFASGSSAHDSPIKTDDRGVGSQGTVSTNGGTLENIHSESGVSAKATTGDQQSSATLADEPQTRKDPKSFTQNLFDTLSLRMVEWLPLRRTGACASSSSNASDVPPSGLSPKSDKVAEKHKNKSENLSDSCESINQNGPSTPKEPTPPSTITNISSPTLEVKVPGQPVKRLSLGELEPYKQAQRSVADDRTKSRRRRSQKISVNNTPSTTASHPIPSPPALKHRPQKNRRMAGEVNTSLKPQGRRLSWDASEFSRKLISGDVEAMHTPTESTSKSHLQSEGPDSGFQQHLGGVVDIQHAQSLSHLSKDIVDGLENIMFESEEDEKEWSCEMKQFELRGYSEPWDLQYATHRQRHSFPFVAQSIFYTLSSPSQLLLSFRSNPEGPEAHSLSSTPLPIDVANIEDTFKKIYRLCPWEITMNSLWICLERLFIPPKELSISTRHQRRSSRSLPLSRSSSLGREPIPTDGYVSDHDAAYITVVTFLALVSAIPRMDSNTWDMVRHIRSSGTVLPDSELKRSEVSTELIVNVSDKFEHGLALRLMHRLSRVISARLAFHEISKAKNAHIRDIEIADKSDLVQLIIGALQRFRTLEPNSFDQQLGMQNVERTANVSMVVVEWLRSLLLREWDGKPQLSKSSAAGGALQLLDFMYNDRAKLGLQPEDFHTAFFSDRLDPIDMPIEWLGILPNNQTLHLLSHPFMFPPSALVIYFRALNHSTMTKSFDNAITASKHVSQMAFSPLIPVDDDMGLLSRVKTSITNFLVLTIRREHPMVDAFNQLWRRERRELLRPLKVQMGMDEGEEGVDQGGVQQEFFRVVLAEAMDPSFGMFTVDSRSGMWWFQPCSFEPLFKFELLGLLVSLAIYNGLTLPVNFPVVLYRKLLGLDVSSIDHLRIGWPDLAKGLDDLLSWEDGDVGDIFMRTYEFSFEAFGTIETVDMERTDRNEPWPIPERQTAWDKTKIRLSDRRAATKRLSYSEDFDDADGNNSNVSMLREYSGDSKSPLRDTHVIGILKGGSSRQPKPCANAEPQPEASLVTNSNRDKFVKDYIFWLTDKSIRPQYEAFARGFFTCLDRTALSIFTPEALKSVVEGIQEIDVDLLQQYARYEGGYGPNHQIMKDFWDIVKSYSQEKRGQLLEFVTASDRLPVNGIPSIMFMIQKNGVGDSRLPTSLTCFGRLLLPEYSSRSVLEEKLDKALENARGFGVA